MKMTPHILLIAGSAEAHEIAAALVQRGVQTQAILRRAERSFGPLAVSSRIWTPKSVDAMKGHLIAQGITAICDAGHGFDADISSLAAAAATDLGIPYLRVLRPSWHIKPPAMRKASVAEAAQTIAPGARVFAATGRGTVQDFAPFQGACLFLRQTSANARAPLPDFAQPVFGTPPFSQAEESALFQQLHIDTLICRNVGGTPSRPKLDAALALGLHTIVIDRPAPPPGHPRVAGVGDALDWLARL